LINQFKFQRRFELAPTLARLLLLGWLAQQRRLALKKPDLLLPVPLHWWRQWRRGFNQSSLLAAAVAHWLGIAWDATLLQRVQATVPQQQLPAMARRRNLRHAFALAPGAQARLAGQRVALIDDVVTTGSTVWALSQLLRRAGVAEIHIWTLGRTRALW
jgi:ComF family protein